ncbi:RNA 2',3'-cyclic phosphodiesterase [Catellatospora sichuanensis]|uniref:RNA 2',3'-cyclic phosphodiesterase n=1 Tax=Catellatospora sichuanensis TaxID=1969805 RepID=UPI001182ECBE|nr:RNA 2',3'-cyclic phosphodiesterase [Catellatospora sichuanensis]
MRLFVAVFPPPEAVDHLATVVQGLAVGLARARVTPTERWHLTLAFLGEVPDESAGSAALAVSAVEGSVGDLRIRGGGKFGHGRSTVLWAGVEGDVEGLTRVGRAVRRELRAHRLHPDDKRFAPHLTVARPGDRIGHADLTADLAVLRDYTGPTWPVTELVLVRSMLGPNPSYTPLAHHPL